MAEEAARQSLKHFTLTPSVIRIASKPFSSQEQLLHAHNYNRQYVIAHRETARLAHAMRKRMPLQEYVQQNPNWEEFIRDPQNKNIQQAVEKGDYRLAISELIEHYSLDQNGELFGFLKLPASIFASTTIDHLNRHPHHINFRLREVLESFYSASYQTQIKNLIKKDKLTWQDKKRLFDLLCEAYTTYRNFLSEDINSPSIQVPLRAYQETTLAVEEFVQKTGRFPQFNAGPEERQLAQLAETLLKHKEYNLLPPIKPVIEKLESLYQQYPVPVYPKAEFEQAYIEFLNNHPDLDEPRLWHEGYTNEERMLHDSYRYYRSLDYDGINEWVRRLKMQRK